MTKKRGRPFKYKDTYPKEIIELMQQGYKDCQICAHWGISRETFYTWLNTYPDLRASHERGLELCEKWWEDEGRRLMMAGDNKAFNYWIAFMNRKFGWAKKESSGDTQINIQNLNFNNQSKEQLIEFIQGKIEKLTDQNVLDVDYKLIADNDEESTE